MKDHPSQGIHGGLTCRDLTDRASEYLDGRLPILTKVLVAPHLASCTPCRAYVKQINLVSSALRSLPNLYPSPVHRLRLRQQLPRATPPWSAPPSQSVSRRGLSMDGNSLFEPANSTMKWTR